MKDSEEGVAMLFDPYGSALSAAGAAAELAAAFVAGSPPVPQLTSEQAVALQQPAAAANVCAPGIRGSSAFGSVGRERSKRAAPFQVAVPVEAAISGACGVAATEAFQAEQLEESGAAVFAAAVAAGAGVVP